MDEPRGGEGSRNWKWFVPVGCLGLLMTCGGGMLGVVFTVFGAMKNSDVYQQAMVRVRQSPEAVQALGEPIEDGWLIQGSVQQGNHTGEASMSIPISGPRGSGRLKLDARLRASGQWEFHRLQLAVNGGVEPINLLARAGPTQR